ncbi:fumarylacetoacetate hydrolase family protein [Vineibacter terrae]|uniref:fumarylacetoacetate hydrolase family protein n=1 Tax=Vineibacter terrae TaxID=2586908 RepID=UPI002E3074D2|nr:fumarylacetoacetate hydrolase family protein [Vineibacter terrae]HEX2885997.1 fumarylacetoacetate hydrolase family protein [Vineibacter terrae]
MKIATYWWAGRRHVGQLSADGRNVVPLALGESAHAVGALALVEAMASGAPFPRPAGAALPLSAVRLDAPIPVPRRNIFCVGINYRAHAREFASSGYDNAPRAPQQEVPEHPVFFSKVPECVIAPEAPIRIPERVSTSIDYEAELAVIIGRGGSAIAPSRAMEHVWGYTIFNDVTARDLQHRHRQWLIGKSLDTFGPMGPWLACANELDGARTRLRCWVNDELRQDARTEDLVFNIPTLIATVSAGITLYPGDIIATGTPSGVGIGFDPPRFLRRGDRVRIEIDGIGTLVNPVQ